MHIGICIKSTGLANNGGSRTILRCGETLVQLGYDVTFWGSGLGRYTWHKPEGIRFSKAEPAVDVMIATGWGSYGHTLTCRARHKSVYVRGLEAWNAPESALLKALSKFRSVFANSEWQVEFFQKHGIQAVLQYPGLDPWFYDIHEHRAGVGGLMHNKMPTKRSCDLEAIEEKLLIKFAYLNRHIKKPTHERLNAWYNGLQVWVSTSELEGLHNPPYEAGLAGCALVCTDHPRGGTSDYAIDQQTALLYPAREIDSAVECVRRLLTDEPLRARLQKNLVELLHSKMDTREERMREFAGRLEERS